MKKTILFIFGSLIIIAANSFATVRIVNVANYSFTPSPLNAFIGDTIKWQWVSGTHTTTSSTIPPGAAVWSNPIDLSNTNFIYVISAQGTYNYTCTFHGALFGMNGVINAQTAGIKQIETIVQNYKLEQNYPNPFNPVTVIRFNIPQKSFVSLKLYDITGKELGTLVNSNMNEGGYAVDFNAADYASGVYIYRLQAGNFTDTKRMMLIK